MTNKQNILKLLLHLSKIIFLMDSVCECMCEYYINHSHIDVGCFDKDQI